MAKYICHSYIMVLTANTYNSLRGILLFALISIFALPMQAQQNIDKIIAVVGKNRIILQSELDAQAIEAKKQEPNMTDDAINCNLLQQMVTQKLLVEQADRDSVMVSDDEVEGTLDNRIRYFIRMYGSKENLEKSVGRTVYQLKEDYRDVVKEQMIYEKMLSQVIQNVRVTPAEVRTFYNTIPSDSLPFLPASVQIGQIVIDPPVSAEMDQYAKAKIEGIRKDITEGGKSFEVEAGIYSEDPGSRDNGGRYDGVTRTGGWAPEFVAAAFKLKNGEVSQPIKTKFGYHIIQMIDRKGDEADLRHILIKPQITTVDYKAALDKLDSVRAELISGKITFPEAVGKYSTDENAKRTGGMIQDPNTGSADLEVSKLDPSMILIIDSLTSGQFSHPHVFNTDAGERSCRIVYLVNRTTPHKANMKDDYSKLQEFALNQKKAKKLHEWIMMKLSSYYLKIDPQYLKGCDVLKTWQDVSGAN